MAVYNERLFRSTEVNRNSKLYQKNISKTEKRFKALEKPVKHDKIDRKTFLIALLLFYRTKN